MRNWLIALVMAVPCALSAQMGRVPDNQCVYRLGDKPAWAAVNVDSSGWKPYTEYRLTGDAYVVWVRCRVTVDIGATQSPAVGVGSDGPEEVQAFVDGQPVNASSAFWIYPIPAGPAKATHIVALRVVQHELAPGLTPGRPVYLYLGDALSNQALAEARRGDGLREAVPAYSCFLVIGVSGLFLLGLVLFDRSQKAAFWLGIYCCCVCLPRISAMVTTYTGKTSPTSSRVGSSASRCSSHGRWFA